MSGHGVQGFSLFYVVILMQLIQAKFDEGSRMRFKQSQAICLRNHGLGQLFLAQNTRTTLNREKSLVTSNRFSRMTQHFYSSVLSLILQYFSLWLIRVIDKNHLIIIYLLYTNVCSLNAYFLNETSSLRFDTRFLLFYITCATQHTY